MKKLISKSSNEVAILNPIANTIYYPASGITNRVRIIKDPSTNNIIKIKLAA